MKALLHQTILQRTIIRTLTGGTQSHSLWTGQTLRDASVSSSPRFSRSALVFFPATLSLSLLPSFFPLIHCLAPKYIVQPPSFGHGCLENKHVPMSRFLPVLTDTKQCPPGPGEAAQPPISLLCRQNQGTQQKNP